ENERELLNRGDDDLLPLGDEPAQVPRVLCMTHRRAYLRKLLDRVADLLVEDPTVSDDDDRIEDRRLVLLQSNELVREPGNRVRLAAAGRVLDQIPPAGTIRLPVGEQPAHDVELVVARPDLHRLLLAGLFVP